MRAPVALFVFSVLCVSVLGIDTLDDVKRINQEAGLSRVRGPLVRNRLASDGYLAFPGQFPYHAAIVIKPRSLNRIRTCGGALITSNYVLTTAFCVNYRNNQIEYAFITLGSLFDGSTPWEQHFNFTESSIRTHPFYNIPLYSYLNDIGTVRLNRTATLNEYVQPIRLPRLSDTRTYEMMEGTVVSAIEGEGLRYLRNQVMVNADCQENALYQDIEDQRICTDSYIGGTFCSRQSGSALTVEDESGRVLVGITDTLIWCELIYPIRHVRITYFRDFIKANSDYIFEP